MLRALKRLLGARRRSSISSWSADAPARDAARRRASCWRGCARSASRAIERCRLTRNRHVMVSFSGGALRVHEGYLERAARTSCARSSPSSRDARAPSDAAAQRDHRRSSDRDDVAGRRAAPRTRPEDEPLVAELARVARALQRRAFRRPLEAVAAPRLAPHEEPAGTLHGAAHGEPAEIAISWRHIRRDGWDGGAAHAAARDGAPVAGRDRAGDRPWCRSSAPRRARSGSRHSRGAR